MSPLPCESDKNLSCFPARVDDFTFRNKEDVIEPDHINRLQDAVVQLQRKVLAMTPGGGGDGDAGVDFSGLIAEDDGSGGVKFHCTQVTLLQDQNGDETLQEYSSVNLTAIFGQEGLGGREPGSVVGSNQWWGVYLVGDSSGQLPLAGYLVPATMGEGDKSPPAGYDLMTRVASVVTDGSGTLRQFLQVDNRIYYKDAQSGWTATSATSGWVKVPLHQLVSPFSREAMLMTRVTRGGGSGIANMNVRFPGAIGDRGLLTVQTGDSSGDTDFASATVPTDADRAIEYRVGGTASPLEVEGMVVGYIDRYISSAED